MDRELSWSRSQNFNSHRSPTSATVIEIPEEDLKISRNDVEIGPTPMRFAVVAVAALVIFVQVIITSQDSDTI